MATAISALTMWQGPTSTPVVQRLSYSPLDQRFAGSITAEVDGFFQSVKILSMPSFWRETKPWAPCSRFTARKRTSSRKTQILSAFINFVWIDFSVYKLLGESTFYTRVRARTHTHTHTHTYTLTHARARIHTHARTHTHLLSHSLTQIQKSLYKYRFYAKLQTRGYKVMYFMIKSLSSRWGKRRDVSMSGSVQDRF